MKQYLKQLADGFDLSREQAHDFILRLTKEEFNDAQIAALLMAIQMRGVSVDEILGLRDGLLETGLPVDVSPYDTIDIVGTGGDGKNTFNISTCAAFVLAGAGYKVTKHGNFAATSVSGASTVMEQMGVKFSTDHDQLMRSLETSNVIYFHAPLFAYGMKFVAPVRKALGIPTCFNLLGPLVNPCKPKYNFFGTANLPQLRLYTNVMSRVNRHFGIVSSYDGYDEVSLTSEFKISTNNGEQVLDAAALGLQPCQQSDIYGGQTKEEAATIFLNILENKATLPQTQVVTANAAMAISIMEPTLSLTDCVAKATESLQSGRALQALKKFVEINS